MKKVSFFLKVGSVFLLLCFCLVPANRSFAQNKRASEADLNETEAYPAEDVKSLKLDYGLNLGGYFASKSTANYYNGSGLYSGTGTQGTVERILNPSHTYYYTQIREDIGYDFTLHELPLDMRYSPAMMFGLYASLSLNTRLSAVVESNFCKLKAEDQFTLKLARFSSIEGDNIERFLIRGTEERIDIRLGLSHAFFSGNNNVHPFIGAGISVTDTKVKDNFIRIGQRTYNLHYAGTSQYFPERDYGMGFGFYTNLGLSMDVSEDFRFSFGYSTHYNRIRLGNYEGFGFQHSIFLRLSLSGLFKQGSHSNFGI